RNTRSVCRSCYIHPGVIDAYRDGDLCVAWEKPAPARTKLRRDEVLVASLLRKLERRAARGRATTAA
ncbi:MAG TPA: DNA topoisomerase IB, partial [Actinomycetota bacterium]|nr:DNA topoisomerase IB [Actinomycetota bacterium]